VSLCGETNPVIVIGAEEDPSTIILPRLQDSRFASVGRAVDPIVALLLFRVKGVISWPVVSSLLLL